MENANHLNNIPFSRKTHSVPAVYKITNNIDGKIYVGGTKNYYDRARNHAATAKLDINKNRKLYSAFREYGVENFTFSIIEVLPDSEIILAQKERYYIHVFDCCDERKGYNTYPMLSSKYIADWLGVGKATFSNIINGNRYPSREKAVSLAERSGVSFEDWMLSDRESLKEKVYAAFEARGGDLRKHLKERGRKQMQVEKRRTK